VNKGSKKEMDRIYHSLDVIIIFDTGRRHRLVGIPVLANDSMRTNRPSAFSSENGDAFVLRIVMCFIALIQRTVLTL
jgi:hypothetical protein